MPQLEALVFSWTRVSSSLSNILKEPGQPLLVRKRSLNYASTVHAEPWLHAGRNGPRQSGFPQ